MAEGQDSQKKITITIKTPKEKQSVEIEEDASIKDVSTIVMDSCRLPTSILYLFHFCNITHEDVISVFGHVIFNYRFFSSFQM